MAEIIADQNRKEVAQEIWCPRHLAPAIIECLSPMAGSVKLFVRLMLDPLFFKSCGGEMDAAGTYVKAPADANRIAAALNTIAPVCCYLGDAAVEEIWAEVRRDLARRCGH